MAVPATRGPSHSNPARGATASGVGLNVPDFVSCDPMTLTTACKGVDCGGKQGVAKLLVPP